MTELSDADTETKGAPVRSWRPSPVGSALWLLFAVFVIAGGWLFLNACGLDALGFDYCPARGDRDALVREAAVGDDLARQVHMAQLTITEAPICPLPSPRPVPIVTTPVPSRAESETIDQSVVERGGQNGSLQFTLEWATRDDLDLNVNCPGGRISSQSGHAGPGICGDGRKDIDANRNLTENVSTNPIENIVWQNDIPQGDYRVEVIEYRAATPAGNTVPFTLRLRLNGEERICHDAVSTTPVGNEEIVDGQRLGGTERVLRFTLGDTLPDCSFTVENTFRGGPEK